MTSNVRASLSAASLLIAVAAAYAGDVPQNLVDDSWKQVAPRDEIRPQFAFDLKGGRDGKPALRIAADERAGLAGHWEKTVPVQGGQHYRFSALRKVEGTTEPRRDVFARVV